MNFLMTTAQFMKSFAGAAFFGLSSEQVSCRLTAVFPCRRGKQPFRPRMSEAGSRTQPISIAYTKLR